MTRRRTQMIFGLYVVAAGLLLALGAAARYSRGGAGQSPSSQEAQNSEQMGRGMMSGRMGRVVTEQKRDMVATRWKMRHTVDELMENQAVMDKAKSVHGIKPLLKKNRELLEKLNDEMADSWGMHRAMHSTMHGATHGAMHGRVMSSRMSSPAPTKKPRAAAPASKPAESAEQSRLVARGKKVFRSHGCHICHGATGEGTSVGVSLIGIGKKDSAEEIAERIRHPKTTKMPAFSKTALPEADVKAVIAYLETLKK
jgi:mono/diheme cytochrome c family protein